MRRRRSRSGVGLWSRRRRSDVRLEAEAEAERRRLEAEAEAERRRLEAQAEAERRRLEAEADAARRREEESLNRAQGRWAGRKGRLLPTKEELAVLAETARLEGQGRVPHAVRAISALEHSESLRMEALVKRAILLSAPRVCLAASPGPCEPELPLSPAPSDALFIHYYSMTADAERGP